MKKKWPPLDQGTRVLTTKPDLSDWDQWTAEGLKAKRWGEKGRIIRHIDVHGLCYEVQHVDGRMAWYGPNEFVELKFDLVLNLAHRALMEAESSVASAEASNVHDQESFDRMLALRSEIAALKELAGLEAKAA